MSKQSVFRKRLYERIRKQQSLEVSSESEVSIGDRHGKCEDVESVII
jgi:hypothetical protein